MNYLDVGTPHGVSYFTHPTASERPKVTATTERMRKVPKGGDFRFLLVCLNWSQVITQNVRQSDTIVKDIMLYFYFQVSLTERRWYVPPSPTPTLHISETHGFFHPY